MKTFKELWSEIDENFAFEGIHTAMVALNWRWHDVGIPTVKQLRKEAKRQCKVAYDAYFTNGNKTSSISTGGFTAKYKKGNLSLRFAIDEITTRNNLIGW